jgi:hypothetical protein
MRFVSLAAFLIATGIVIHGASDLASSQWAFLENGKLKYRTTERGDRIMDFSYAGYEGGGIALPKVPVARTLRAVAGDNTPQIQAAIDAVAALPVGSGGFRGAVLLSPGTYEVEHTVTIAADGVVLRGSGAGTIIRLTGRPHRFLEIRGNGESKETGAAARITDAYVPSGAQTFHVDRADAFHVGDSVFVRHPVTAEWVHFMGMDTLVRNGKPQTWIRAGSVIRTDRRIQAIDGNRITLDVPLSDSLDAHFLGADGASVAAYSFPGRIRHVAVESLRVTTPATDVPISGPQYTFLRMDAVSDAWVRDVAVDETQNGIVIGYSARRVTFENVSIHHGIPHSGSAAPADFSICGTQILLDRCSVSGQGTWPVVTQAMVPGPNVILRFRADQAGISPHQRWATGLLVDRSEFRNNTERRPGIAFSNRKTAGSGHGWDIGWAVAWNVQSDYFLVVQPPGAMNWCIGCLGKPAASPDAPLGIFDGGGREVNPASLYLQQLKDRLGEAAVEAIGYTGR